MLSRRPGIPPEGTSKAEVPSAFEFVFAPIISALDDPITTMTTAAEEVGSLRPLSMLFSFAAVLLCYASRD